MLIVCRTTIAVALWALLVAFGPFAQSKHPPQTPRVEAKEQPERSNENQADAKRPPQEPQSSIAPNSDKANPGTDTKYSEQEGSEFWPAFLGIRLKITDSLLVLFTFVLAIVTGGLWISTNRLQRESKIASEISNKSADAARKSANAATETAEIMVAIAQSELRPYLSVIVGGGVYQEWEKGLKFAIHPVLLNSGRTQADDMKWWARAAILPFPLPDDFEFPPPETIIESAQVQRVGPQQGIELNAAVADFVPSDEVNDIKSGATRRVHIWGIVTYQDGFREHRITTFCHSIYWCGPLGAEVVRGTYSTRHNQAT